MVYISPLLPLMVDQQSKFSPKGLSTEYVGESQRDLAVKQKILMFSLYIYLLRV